MNHDSAHQYARFHPDTSEQLREKPCRRLPLDPNLLAVSRRRQ